MNERIGMVSLGCAKNQVNAEQMLFLLQQAGFTIAGDPDGCDLAVVNTCGFIDSAKTEAIDHILALGQLKEAGRLGKILVTGKGVRSLKSKHMPATQLFCYSSFVLRKSHGYFYISDSAMKESFFGIRMDLDKLALASYICDVAAEFAVEGIGDEDLMRPSSSLRRFRLLRSFCRSS